jgi:septum formation protein
MSGTSRFGLRAPDGRALVLASTSRWRRGMLETAGIEVISEDPAFDERSVVDRDPFALAMALGRAKADAVVGRHPGHLILGADQVLWTGDEIQGKPPDSEEHVRRLLNLRGRSHSLITGVTVRVDGGGVVASFHAETRMRVRADVTEAEVRAYVTDGEGAGCAGGYAAEGRGAFLFDAVDGDWFNVVGLPVFAVVGALRGLGWRFGEVGHG